MGLWIASAATAAFAMASTAVVLAALILVELAAPRGRHPLASRLKGAMFWSIYIPLSAGILAGLSALWRRLGLGPSPPCPSRPGSRGRDPRARC